MAAVFTLTRYALYVPAAPREELKVVEDGQEQDGLARAVGAGDRRVVEPEKLPPWPQARPQVVLIALV